MPVIKTLILSTAHINPAANTPAYLNDDPFVTEREGGWLVNVDLYQVLMWDNDEAMENLEAILKHAMKLQCGYVILDMDADEEPGLPVYDWSEQEDWNCAPIDDL